MSDRLKALRRIAKVQAQMKRMAEWRLAASEQRLAAVEADRRALGSFLDEGSAVGPLASLALAQTERLARREDTLNAVRDRQSELTLEARRRAKQAETASEALARAEEDESERRTLERLIEAAAGVAPEPRR